ncbi:MAG: hypothetical protein JNM52_09100 [Betaproteobacteria bacterium]|nr:hypothetical protein [Betaproteobacteria bacterium]
MKANVTLQAATFITAAALTPLTTAETGAVNGAGGEESWRAETSTTSGNGTTP